MVPERRIRTLQGRRQVRHIELDASTQQDLNRGAVNAPAIKKMRMGNVLEVPPEPLEAKTLGGWSGALSDDGGLLTGDFQSSVLNPTDCRPAKAAPTA